VLPELERDVRDVSGALEEEERDESFRRKRWFAAREKKIARFARERNDAGAS